MTSAAVCKPTLTVNILCQKEKKLYTVYVKVQEGEAGSVLMRQQTHIEHSRLLVTAVPL